MGAVALIACDHGFGHLRRSLLVAGGLARAGHAVTLFAPVARAARFPAPAGSVQVVDFATCTTVAGLRSGDPAAIHWHRRLPALDGYDLVVSDNLPEILEARPDAVLSGSFLWHQALPDMDEAAAARARDLLARHRPMMVAGALFAAPELMAVTRTNPVGLVVDGPRPAGKGADLLIACGGSREAEAAYASAIDQLAAGPQPAPFDIVWVEPRLLPAQAPAWMRPAGFDGDFYSRLAAAVCRPGIGTVTDCLWAGARVFAAFEAGNGEMVFNARRLAEAGVGETYDRPQVAIAAAIAHMHDGTSRDRHRRAVAAVDFGGLGQTVALLGQLAG